MNVNCLLFLLRSVSTILPNRGLAATFLSAQFITGSMMADATDVELSGCERDAQDLMASSERGAQ
jgi:hypothetical protein